MTVGKTERRDEATYETLGPMPWQSKRCTSAEVAGNTWRAQAIRRSTAGAGATSRVSDGVASNTEAHLFHCVRMLLTNAAAEAPSSASP